jgi:hypothetical protein
VEYGFVRVFRAMRHASRKQSVWLSGSAHRHVKGPNSALLGAVRLGIAHRADWPRHSY